MFLGESVGVSQEEINLCVYWLSKDHPPLVGECQPIILSRLERWTEGTFLCVWEFHLLLSLGIGTTLSWAAGS